MSGRTLARVVAAWAVVCLLLQGVVLCAVVSEAVRWDRKRPGAYTGMSVDERRHFLVSVGLPALAGLTLAGLSFAAAQQGSWPLAGLLFATQAVVLLLGAAWTRRVLTELLG